MIQTPEWLKPGELVEFAFSVGEIQDVAVSEQRIMVLVKSPKGIWRNHPAEWLEFKSDAIKPAARERAEREVKLYRGYVRQMLSALDELEMSWQLNGADQSSQEPTSSAISEH